jgi:protein CsiD
MALALDRSYTIAPHPHHQRLRHVSLAPEVVRAFLADIAPISVQELEYVPYMRFVIGARLADVAASRSASAP